MNLFMIRLEIKRGTICRDAADGAFDKRLMKISRAMC